MKAKNFEEVRKSYLIFIAYFTALLIVSVMCWSLSVLTESHFLSEVRIKKEEINLYRTQNTVLNNKIDSINTLISMLNTQMVANEDALERKILQLKNESIEHIEKFESGSKYNFTIYKRVLNDVDKILDAKNALQKNKEEEKISKAKLQDCNNANSKLRNRK